MRLEPLPPTDAMAAIRAPFAGLDAVLVDAPVMQPLGLLLDLAGEAMRARLFVVQGDGEEACLRPDFTIPISRMHIASGDAGGRYTYEGKAFRVSPRGSDHPEEFLQIGLESFGESVAPLADAEAASVAWRSAAAGGRDDLRMTLGDVGLFSAFVGGLGLSAPQTARLRRAFSRPAAVAAELDRASGPAVAARQGDRLAAMIAGLPEAEACAVLEDVWALAGIAPVGGRTAGEIVHRLVERAQAAQGSRISAATADLVRRYLEIVDTPRRALERVEALAREAGVDLAAPLQDWSARLDGLVGAGTPEDRLTLETGFGRAFGYYDGFLFEVVSTTLGADSPVAGGGRYDSLPGRLGATSVAAAVGCMVRPARAWSGAENR
jgi:ATP phosphoribosyltransferase regulatory subunit